MAERFAQLVFHIGQHKTGTTTLQRALALNRSALARRGILYPRLPGWRDAQHALAPALLGIAHTNPYVRRRLGHTDDAALAASVRALDRLRVRAAEHPDRTLVLSSESAFRDLPAEARAQFLAALDSLAQEIRMVAYIRHPADQYLSAMNTLVQALQVIRPPGRTGRRNTLEPYAAADGINLVVRPFLQERLHGGDIVSDFAVRGLGTDADALPRRPKRALNQSLSAEAMAVMLDYTHRRGGPGDGALTRRDQLFREAVRRLDRHVPGYTRPALHPQIAAAVLSETKDLSWLRDRCGCVFPGIDYASAGTGSDVDFRDLTGIEDLCPVDPDRLARLRRLTSWMMPRASA